MLGFIKVTGNSLSPLYQEGDFVLVVKIPSFYSKLKPGDIVVFRYPYYGTLIKRVKRLSPDGEEIYVVGTQPDSTDSRQFGAINRADLIGKVVWHIKKPNRQDGIIKGA